MPFTTEYSNTINATNVIRDVASENLRAAAPVWRQHVIREDMPSGTTVVEIPKKGELFRLALPENTEYTFGSYSEYTESSVSLSPMKHAVISRETLESRKFSRRTLPTIFAEEQGKAFSAGAEEDISSLAIGYTANVDTGAALRMLDLHAAALEVTQATNNHNLMESSLVAVLHNKSWYEMSSEQILNTTAGALQIFANPGSSAPAALEAQAAPMAAGRPGFRINLAGVDIYTTQIVDQSGGDYINLVFDPSRWMVGLWDDQVTSLTDQDITFFRFLFGTAWFSDYAIYYNEAGCRLHGPVA